MKIKKIIISSLVLASVLVSQTGLAFADFDPNVLVPDATFSDTQTFGSAAGIQQFLTSKNSALANTNPDFLLRLSEPQSSTIKAGLNDPEPNLGRLRSAAELIWDVAKATGINPQVILVTLEKEQSLVDKNFTDPNDLQRALNHAMGFGCPDSGGCDAIFNGFYYQLFGNFDAEGNRYLGAAASLMKSFRTDGGRGPMIDAQGSTFGDPKVRISHVGDTIILQNTTGAPYNANPTQVVTLGNLATAALYRYTPHVYNGNYNFWRFFQSWFKYPNGTLIHLQSDLMTYIINNGLKQQIPNFVISSRGLNSANAIVVSPTEFSNYSTGPIYAPADNVIIKVATDPAGTLYVFENGTKHQASAFVLQQRGLNALNALSVDQSEADLFQTGGLLTPKDGTLIKGDGSKTVYVIQSGQKKILTGFTFSQYGYSFRNVVTLPQTEVEGYEGNQFLLPKNGTLVKVTGQPAVYVLSNQLLKPISYTVFKLYKYSFSNVASLSSDELAAASLDGFVTPPEGTYFRVSGIPAFYQYKNGTKHFISYFVFKQRNVGAVAVNLSLDETIGIPEGSVLPPKDGTLIKGDQSATIYAIVKGQKVALSYNTWVKTYGKRAPNVLSQAEVDSYPSPQQ